MSGSSCVGSPGLGRAEPSRARDARARGFRSSSPRVRGHGAEPLRRTCSWEHGFLGTRSALCHGRSWDLAHLAPWESCGELIAGAQVHLLLVAAPRTRERAETRGSQGAEFLPASKAKGRRSSHGLSQLGRSLTSKTWTSARCSWSWAMESCRCKPCCRAELAALSACAASPDSCRARDLVCSSLGVVRRENPKNSPF